ncbi:MAG: alpha/beta fold hydrolase, partial [Rickettsiales bacterium]
MTNAPKFLDVKHDKIAYHHVEGTEPGVLFLGGFMSDMEGGKATAMEAFATEQGWQFTRMDYGGHGQSSGTFAEGTIGLWLSHALAVFDKVTSGKQVLVGSSMGGWMMLLLALARPERVAGIVGIASAPDFTENLIWNAFSRDQRHEMEETGRVM